MHALTVCLQVHSHISTRGRIQIKVMTTLPLIHWFSSFYVTKIENLNHAFGGELTLLPKWRLWFFKHNWSKYWFSWKKTSPNAYLNIDSLEIRTWRKKHGAVVRTLIWIGLVFISRFLDSKNENPLFRLYQQENIRPSFCLLLSKNKNSNTRRHY